MVISYTFHISSKGNAISTKVQVARVEKHNTRAYGSSTYDRSKVIVLRGSGKATLDEIKRIYHEEFDEAIDRFNEKMIEAGTPERQRYISRDSAGHLMKDKDGRYVRTKDPDPYFNEVSSRSQTQIAIEIIVELGDRDFWSDKSEEQKRVMERIFDEQIRELMKLVPELRIASAEVHFDEISPHMHTVVVPVASGYKIGLEKRVSKTRVFTKERLSFLQDRMREAAEREMKKYPETFRDVQIKEKKEGRNVDLPKKLLAPFYALQKEIERLKTEIHELKKEKAEIKKSCDEREKKIEQRERTLDERKVYIEKKEAEIGGREKSVEKREAAVRRDWGELEDYRREVQEASRKMLEEIKRKRRKVTARMLSFIKGKERSVIERFIEKEEKIEAELVRTAAYYDRCSAPFDTEAQTDRIVVEVMTETEVPEKEREDAEVVQEHEL